MPSQMLRAVWEKNAEQIAETPQRAVSMLMMIIKTLIKMMQ
jgi:hypothetical protein